MNKIIYLILFLFLTKLYSNDYYYSFDKKIDLIKNNNFYSFKSDIDIDSIKKRILDCKNINFINILASTDKKLFVIKSKNNRSDIKRCLKEYSVEDYQSYYVNNPINSINSWPLIPSEKLIISFKEDISEEKINEIMIKYNLKLIKKSNLLDLFYIFKVEPKKAIKISKDIYELNIVKYSEPDFYTPYYKKFIPNDTLFPDQWHLADGVGGVNIKKAWDITKGNSNIKIAIVDDGIDLNHEDLNIIAHKNFTNEDYPIGGTHGTACAGVASGKGNNNIGITGACINCSIMSSKIMLEDQNYGYTTSTPSGEAIEWATNNGADIISNSWGYRSYRPIPIYLHNSINYATSRGRNGKGAIVVFAAGNENRDLQSDELEAHSNILSIAASTSEDTRSSYSNYGNYLTVCAPTSGGTKSIVTSDAYKIVNGHDTRGYNKDGIYIHGGEDIDSTGKYTKTFGGTSSATPLVSGIIGLMLSINSGLTFLEVRELIIRNTQKIGLASAYNSNGYSTKFGYGKIDAYKTILATQAGLGCIPTASKEICDNNIDDDCDEKIDKNDKDCLVGNSCDSAMDTISKSGQFSADSSKSFYENNFTAPTNCIDNSSSRDFVYRVFLERPQKVTFELKDAHFDSVIYLIKNDCNIGDVIACNDEKGTESHLSKISKKLDGGVYFLVIDGFNTMNSGSFLLDVKFEDLPNPCQNENCSNHGICKSRGSLKTCLCDNGYYKDEMNCIALSEKCKNFVCNNGKCLINLDDNTPFCECDKNYEMKNNLCTKINPCDKVTCGSNMFCDAGECLCRDNYHQYNKKCISDKSCLDIKCNKNHSCKYGKCVYEEPKKENDSCSYSYTTNNLYIFLYFIFLIIFILRTKRN